MAFMNMTEMDLENTLKGPKKTKNRGNKVNLIFDENKRREFLTGFHKRKVQRQKEAKEKFERDLNEERKRIKAEAKQRYKKLVLSHRPVPELENLTNEEYIEDDTTVKIVELSTSDIAKKNNWIGANQPNYVSKKTEGEEHIEDEVIGMELETRQKEMKARIHEVKFQTEKDLKKTLKKQATKRVKKSKVFQIKNKLERQKQKKQSLQIKKHKKKLNDKKSKKYRKGN